MILTHGIKLLAKILQEGLAKSIYGAQRGTQIMRDRVGKGFEFLIDIVQLGRPLLNPLFQFVMGLSQSLDRVPEFVTTYY